MSRPMAGRAIGPAADLEYYPTPAPFTRWLIGELECRGIVVAGRIYEPCVGDGAILRGASDAGVPMNVGWMTNDLDRHWPAHTHLDARSPAAWQRPVDWVITNPPFAAAVDILVPAITHARVGVAMHVRCSIKEPPKTEGIRRTLFRECPPTGTLWLPRFSYQRNTKGKWANDSMTCVWLIWLRAKRPLFEAYAPDWVIADVQAIQDARAAADKATRRLARSRRAA